MKKVTLECGTVVEISDEKYQEYLDAASWPEKGDNYWVVERDGFVREWTWRWYISDHKSKKQNNIYKTKKDAEMAAIRDRGMRVRGTAVEGEKFWVWCFYFGQPEIKPSRSMCHFPEIPKWKTKEECQAWADECVEAIIYMSKLDY